MIEGVAVKKLQKLEDTRGWLCEIFRSDEIAYQPMMSYVSLTKPGVVRGPHEHQYQTDCFIFFGPGNFVLHLWDRREGSSTKGEYQKIEAGEESPCLIIVPPGIVHGYQCVSQEAGWCINLPDKLYKGEDKQKEVDEIRWEDNPDSPYQIS